MTAAPTWLALADGTLYVGAAIGSLRTPALDGERGDELWRLDGVTPAAVVGEPVYAFADDRRLVALRN